MKLTEAIACGECLSYTMKWAMIHTRDKGARVVYAEVKDPWDNKKYNHAWGEYKGKVYDWQTMEAKLSKYAGNGWPIKEFYDAYKPNKRTLKKFPVKSAVQNRKETGHIIGWNWPGG